MTKIINKINFRQNSRSLRLLSRLPARRQTRRNKYPYRRLVHCISGVNWGGRFREPPQSWQSIVFPFRHLFVQSERASCSAGFPGYRFFRQRVSRFSRHCRRAGVGISWSKLARLDYRRGRRAKTVNRRSFDSTGRPLPERGKMKREAKSWK